MLPRTLRLFKLLVDEDLIPATTLLDIMQENQHFREYFDYQPYWRYLLHRHYACYSHDDGDFLAEYAFRASPQRVAESGSLTAYATAYSAFPKAKILYKTAMTYFSIDVPCVSEIISKSTTWKFDQMLLIANRLDTQLMCIWHVPKIPIEYVKIYNIVVSTGFSIFRNRYCSLTVTSHLSSYHKHEGYQRHKRLLDRGSPFKFSMEDAESGVQRRGKKFIRTNDSTRDLKAIKLDLKKPNISRSDPIRLLIHMTLNPHETNYLISGNRINIIENGMPWTIDIYNQDDPHNPVWQSVSLSRAPNNYTSCEIYKNGFLLRTEDQSDALYECDIYGNITPIGEPINFASHKENRIYSYDIAPDWLTEPIDYEMLEMSNCESASQTRAYLALDDDDQLAHEWQLPDDAYVSINLVSDGYLKRLPSE